MLNDLENFGFVLGAFGALLGGLSILRRYGPSDPEFLRKILHAGMGLVALLLPWLLASAWPVVVLAGILVGMLLAIRLNPQLRKGVGGLLYDVGRNSWGEAYFALGVVCLFMLGMDEPLLYGVPVLVLALADTASSLIGRHGRLRFKVWGGTKSVEGSVAFLVTAFLVAAFSLFVFAPFGGFDGFLAALALVLPVTLIEAAAGGGSDNFFVPLATFVLLKSLLAMSRPQLLMALAIVIVAVPRTYLFLYKRARSVARPRTAPELELDILRNCI